MSAQRLILIVAIAFGLGYTWLRGAFVPLLANEAAAETVVLRPGQTRAVFAAGCFWSAESAYEGKPGVVAVTSGYTGGHVPNPTYQQILGGGTGHLEAVEVVYDERQTSYAALLDIYWHTIDPFQASGQFCDVGEQYRPAIFAAADSQRLAAETSREAIARRFDRPVAVRVEAAAPFYPAEEYHQDYAARHPAQYSFYRWTCGRDARLSRIWR